MGKIWTLISIYVFSYRYKTKTPNDIYSLAVILQKQLDIKVLFPKILTYNKDINYEN